MSELTRGEMNSSRHSIRRSSPEVGQGLARLPLEAAARRLAAEERYGHRSTIITTNLAYEEWHNFLGNKAVVDALLSRLQQAGRTVRIDGPSLRDPTA